MAAHPSATTLRQRRFAERVMVDGRWVHPTAPAHVHGKSMGYMSYGCRCSPCSAWNWRAKQVSIERQIHNMQLLMQMKTPADERIKIADPGLEKLLDVSAKPTITYLDAEPRPPRQKPERRIKPKIDLDPPPLIPAVRERIGTVSMLEKITKAYYEPDWRAPVDRLHSNDQDRERRTFQDVEIVVGESGHVIWFTEREVATGTPEIVTASQKALPKVRGTGGGSRGPRDQDALIAALKASGCDVTKTGSGHIRVTKDGKSLILPSTASDWRSLQNSLAQARRQGLL